MKSKSEQELKEFVEPDKKTEESVQKITYQEEIKNCLNEFDIDSDDESEILELIQKNDEKYLLMAKKKKRQAFKTRVCQILAKHEKKFEQVKKTHLTVFFNDNSVYFEEEIDEDWLKNILRGRFGIENEKDYIFILNKVMIKNLSQIFEEKKTQLLLNIEKKIKVLYEFHEKHSSLKISKNMDNIKISQLVLEEINQKMGSEMDNLTFEELELMYQFQNDNCSSFENFNEAKMMYGDFKKIIVQQKIKIIVYYGMKIVQFQMKSYENFSNLQDKIQEEFFVKEAQKLQLKNGQDKFQLKEENQNDRIFNFLKEKNQIKLELTNSHTKEYYGFHKNYPLTYKEFSFFQVENEKETQNKLSGCSFSSTYLEKYFFEIFIKSLFLSMKKRFPIQTMISRFKDLVFKIQEEQIWLPFSEKKPIKMNEYFVLQYLLYNSDHRLQIQLMNLVKSIMPIPIYFRKFSHILDVSNDFLLNKQLIWNLKQGVTVGSIGFHNIDNFSSQKGKTSLLNQLFFTNFPLNQEKHKIIEKVPFIYIRVYDDLFPLNIIDIPHSCEKEEMVSDLIKCCNILFIHSWRSEEQSRKYKEEIEQKYKIKVILLLRDTKQNKTDQLKILKKAQIQKDSFLKIPNISNHEIWKSFFDIFRQKINSFLKNFKIAKEQLFFCYSFFKNDEFQKFNNLLSEFEEQNSLLCEFIEKKEILKNDTFSNEDQIKKIFQKGLNKKILNILDFIEKQTFPKEISLMHFRQKIRTIQNQHTAKYMRIYKMKDKIKKLQQQNSLEFQKEVKFVHQNMLSLPELYTAQDNFLDKKKQQILNIFERITYDFENKIRPKIFSIELFWREIYSFYQFQKANHSPQTIFEKFVDLKGKQILNTQPFQIIDGDALQMPRDAMKQIFKPFTERCLVLTIIGPQSSGKSTLLNFLFGCDFATSQGRCTRGVYGTFFRFNDKKIGNFEGIFVIDTEGLFAITNEKDKQKEDRDDFDSKLVLFCLAVSDFVIINVRGNLDHNTEKILRICYDKLEELNLPEQERPQIVIVLNQNNTSKTDESENEFKKIQKTLKFNIARSLSLAYEIKNYTHTDISLFSENETLTKKIPSKHFLHQTTQLLEEIIKKMKTKKTAEKIFNKIDNFSNIWSTVLEFPHLSRLTSKQYNQLELQIKKWKAKEDQNFHKKFDQILAQFTHEKIDEKAAFSRVQELNDQYQEKYMAKYPSERYESDLKLLIEQEKKQIMLKKQINQTNIRYKSTEIKLQKQLKKEKFEGDQGIREKERQINSNQSKKNQKYTQDQKIKIFQQRFNEKLQKLKKSLTINNKKYIQLERVLSEYNFFLKSTRFSVQGLPNIKNIISDSDFDKKPKEFREILKQRIMQSLDSSDLLMYQNRPYTNIISQSSNTDVKNKYFDMRKYYTKVNKKEIFYLQKKLIFLQTLNYQKIGYFIKDYLIAKQKQWKYQKLQEVYFEINTYLEQTFALEIKSFDNFYKKFIYETVEKSWSLWGDDSDTQKLEIQFLNKETKKSSKNEFVDLSFKDVYSKKKQKHSKNYVEKKLGSQIKWKNIEAMIKKQRKQTFSDHSKGDKELLKEINKDLNKINLFLSKSCKIISFFQSSESCYIFSSQSSQKKKFGESLFPYLLSKKDEYQIQNYDNFMSKFHQLQYFYGWQLKQYVTSLENKKSESVAIAELNTFQLKQKKQQFKGYIQKDRKITATFKSSAFRQFIYKELKQNGKITLLFEQVITIIEKARQNWKSFNSNAILEIHNNINEEINLFNNDLFQISNVMTGIFIGRVHFFAANVIWKNEVDRIQEEQLKLYQKTKNQKEGQLEKFLQRTSSNLDVAINAEAVTFIQQIGKSYTKYIKKIKQDEFLKAKKSFKGNYDRQKQQNRIDNQIFKSGDKQRIISYLQEPYKILEKQYNKMYDKEWKSFEENFQEKQIENEFLRDIKALFKQISQNFENKDHIIEGKGGPRDIFQKKTQKDERKIDEQQSMQVLFNFFLDYILKDDQNKIRKCSGIQLKLKKKQLTKLENPKSQITKKILKQIKQNVSTITVKINDIPKFINKLMLVENKEKLSQIIKKATSFTDKEREDFIVLIKVSLCSQKCPCCARICGIQGTHNNSEHKCLYGHQMRAFAGNYMMKNGKKEAFVARCDSLKMSYTMKYNGDWMTWKKFQQNEKLKTSKWLFDDRKNDQETEKKFKQHWAKVGKIYCDHKGIDFVDDNNSIDQLLASEMVHFIFALDESGSMYGKQWEQLMKVIKQTLQKIKKYAGGHGKMYVSIINFSTVCRIISERCDIMDFNPDKINYESGGTYFEPAFQTAYDIAKKNIQDECVMFVFMTDGYGEEPKKGIQNFKQLMNRYPKKFTYSGIEFYSGSGGNQNNQVMKKISSELYGNNFVAHNAEQLMKAYDQAIEIVVFKDDR